MKKRPDPDPVYDLKSVDLPRLKGIALRIMAALLESPFGLLVESSLLKNAGISSLRTKRIEQRTSFQPVFPAGAAGSSPRRTAPRQWPQESGEKGPGFRFTGIHDYARAYREGRTTPEDVALRLLDFIERSDSDNPPLRAFIAVDRDEVLKQAEAAGERIKKGKASSPFDGVPIAIKDELDMVPYPTTMGTSFRRTVSAHRDATIVARLRAAGALLVGKTNMHEIGLGVTGLNPHHGTPRNPYNLDFHTGGSSSGNGAAVASGLCPSAIGADGGGSIRIPAAFCGFVGLKPTFGRVSTSGAEPAAWSVGHLGPMAATAADTALTYLAIAGPDPMDPLTLDQPEPTLKGWNNADLSDLTLGVFWPWFRHASTDVVTVCEALLRAFQDRGAVLKEIAIPHLEDGRVAHSITIASEISQAFAHSYGEFRKSHGLDVRVNLALGYRMNAADYIQAQRARTRMISDFKRALDQVDVIITPATARTAPPIAAAALKSGESDLSTTMEIMRYMTPANLTGLPAISFPAGYSPAGLPVGMQAIGRAWGEVTLLRLAHTAEGVVERRAPALYYNLMTD